MFDDNKLEVLTCQMGREPITLSLFYCDKVIDRCNRSQVRKRNLIEVAARVADKKRLNIAEKVNSFERIKLQLIIAIIILII